MIGHFFHIRIVVSPDTIGIQFPDFRIGEFLPHGNELVEIFLYIAIARYFLVMDVIDEKTGIVFPAFIFFVQVNRTEFGIQSSLHICYKISCRFIPSAPVNECLCFGIYENIARVGMDPVFFCQFSSFPFFGVDFKTDEVFIVYFADFR